MKTRLIFVRHAEAEGNLNRRFHGWTDGGITEKGHRQAVRAAQRLSDINIDVLYASSLKRTLQTAEYISSVKNIPIILTDKLREINGGDWENMLFKDLPVLWPDEYDTWENKPHLHKMPNGESMEEFQARLVSEVMCIIRQNEGGNICIVTHGTAIKALLCYFYGCRLEEMINIPWHDNTAVTVIDYEDGEFTIELDGDTSHIERELSTFASQEWWNEYKEKFSNSNLKKGSINKSMDNGVMKRTEVMNPPGSGSGMLDSSGSGNRSTSTDDKLAGWLFQTGAVRVSPEDKPFWYTSGTIGPYYINTHFLYGCEEKANNLLKKIDSLKDEPLKCTLEIFKETIDNYNTDQIYKGVLDEIIPVITNMPDFALIDMISGGERRDWFFSLTAASLLNKPHLTIFKDMSAVVLENGIVRKADDLKGYRVMHIADLVTEASSFSRAWIPAVEDLGAQMKWSLSVVDRKQGGAEFFEDAGIIFRALASIDRDLFIKALSLGLINEKQFDLISEYMKNPHETMKKFLAANPQFLADSLTAGDKTAERARLCIEKGIYE